MNQTAQADPVFAVCINNRDYPASLELHKIYRVLHDEDAAKDGDIRVVDESGEDYLYPAKDFITIEVPDEVRGALLQASSGVRQDHLIEESKQVGAVKSVVEDGERLTIAIDSILGRIER